MRPRTDFAGRSHYSRVLNWARTGILHGSGAAGHQRILAVVNGMGIGIAETEVKAVSHLAAQGDGRALIYARSCTLKDVNRAELRKRPRQRIDARRKWASQGGGELPGGKGLYCAVAEQVEA